MVLVLVLVLVFRPRLRLGALASKLASEVPAAYREVRDQLRRASLSVALNIAEGVGKTRPADQKRFFAIARGSAMECAAIADVCRVLEIGDEELLNQADELSLSVVKMLSKLCR